MAELTYADVENLSPMPETFFDLKEENRIKWLKAAIEITRQPAKIYQLQRQLLIEFYFTNQYQAGVKICNENKPLREDYYYREKCIISTNQKFDEFLPPMLELIHDARQSNNEKAAAQMLTNLAWRQSQHGDIAGAYSSYEIALAIAPSDDIALLNTIMMDTATNYIVHGDHEYVRKGIALLNRIKEQSLQELNGQVDAAEKTYLMDNIELTDFNTGIAYTLHLYDYAKALEYFDRVNQISGDYTFSALSFSAFAAAKTGQFERAKSYIDQSKAGKKDSPIVNNYLACYRQLAERHWNKKQRLTNCRNLDPETTVEVQLDVYKRLAQSDDSEIELVGLRKLKTLFMNKLEPQLHSRGSQAASNTELRRLQRESELKTVVLQQQKQLQLERDATHANRQKFFIALFVILVTFILLVYSQLRQKKNLAEQFQRMSIRDSLTKLGNRRFLEQQIERELAYIHRAARTDKNAALGIYIFDIDHFKHINDTYGHHAGDEVLIEISKRVSQVTRDTDLLVRWGGEEFLFVARLDNNERTYELAERILKTINSELYEISGNQPIKVTCTVGVVKYPFIDADNIQLWSRLISLADAALYYGKSKQRNCWVVINNENMNQKEQIDDLLSKPLIEAVENKIVTIKTSFD